MSLQGMSNASFKLFEFVAIVIFLSHKGSQGICQHMPMCETGCSWNLWNYPAVLKDVELMSPQEIRFSVRHLRHVIWRNLNTTHGGFHSQLGNPQAAGWFVMENPIQVDENFGGTPMAQETPTTGVQG